MVGFRYGKGFHMTYQYDGGETKTLNCRPVGYEKYAITLTPPALAPEDATLPSCRADPSSSTWWKGA